MASSLVFVFSSPTRIMRATRRRLLRASSRSSRSSYIASTSGLNRSYIRRALDLAGRRDRLALLLGIEHLRQDAERLDLLDARELRVGLVDLGSGSAAAPRMLREAGEAGVGDVVAARPIRNRVEVDLDERGKIFAAVAEHRHLGDIGLRAQRILDERGRQGLAARGDDEVARAVDQPQRCRRCPFADVAGAQPAVVGLAPRASPPSLRQ